MSKNESLYSGEFMKKTISFVLTICLVFSVTLIYTEKTAKAHIFEKQIDMEYTGVLYDVNNGYRNCEFQITSITESTFSGHIYLQAGNYSSTINTNIDNGRITDHDDYCFTCAFELTGNMFNSPSFMITVYPLTGTATGTYGGELFSLYINFTMTGTVLKYYADGFPYRKDDMKLCMELSQLAYNNEGKPNYDVFNEYYYPKALTDTIQARFKNGYCCYNYEDDIYVSDNEIEEAKNNVAFTVTHRDNLDGTVDIFVIIRGTLNDEWQGNLEITGTQYNYQQLEHDNFFKAAESIRAGIKDYYDELRKSFGSSQINLIITGHSRGGAVANIYAKQAVDVKKGVLNIEDIPSFNKVIAYTFACPNVRKYYQGIEDYRTIYNFCFYEDIVPTVPPTSPIEGWNYWKFGRTYTMPISNIIDSTIEYSNINRNISYEVKNALEYWNSVSDYYNKRFYVYNAFGQQIKSSTLFNIAYNAMGLIKSKNNKIRFVSCYNLLNEIGFYKDINPLLLMGIKNYKSIGVAHDFVTYNDVINVKNLSGKLFQPISYNEIIGTQLRTNTSRANRDAVAYNTLEVQKLTAFANSNDNNDILEWDLTDPSSWEGVTWDSNGNVSEIDFTYKWLQGTLDVSGFTSLTKLKVYANTLSSINIDNCTALTSLDCSYNPLSSGLDLEDCTALTELYCDGCGLNTLDISDLEDLEKLSCSFNNLTVLDFSANTELEHLVCCYNYLDTHRGGALHTALLALRGGGVYVNYYPQAVPDNATFNTAELNALKAFALSNDNNDVLDWLDENDNIDTDKLQNNVLFEYDGTEYRVVAIDIAETEVTGSLNLSALSKLEELYCERTGLTSLNVNGCASLEVLSCYGCETETLNLPSNVTSADSPLYNLDCEYNYIDTTMFTQAIIDNISSKDDYVLEYENQKWEDDSALAAVIEFSQGLNGNDYSESSFSVLSDLIDSYEDYENYLLTQDDIDEITAEFLTAISDLEPYLKLKLSGDNGTVTTVYNGETQSGNTHSILFGESVTLTATPDTNYVFDGWYERITQRVYSTDSTYTFPMTTNLDFVARFVKQNAAILTFTNDTGQIVAKIDNTPTEWNDITTLDDLLPDVPYKLGHVNGRWNYIESEVLTALRAGTDITITPVYDATDYVYPEAPIPVDGNPVLNLAFTYDETNDIGSFIMGAGLPQNLDIESMGIAFYLKNKNTFVPDNYILNINNKAVVSRFDRTVPDNRYIVNVHRFAEKYNWCARGFITYHENGALKIAYSNQMNITNTVQNNRRIAISRSVEFSHNIDTIVDDDE